jgi:hypothetical protein
MQTEAACSFTYKTLRCHGTEYRNLNSQCTLLHEVFLSTVLHTCLSARATPNFRPLVSGWPVFRGPTVGPAKRRKRGSLHILGRRWELENTLNTVRDWVTIGGAQNGNRIYGSLKVRNYNQLRRFQEATVQRSV